MFGLNYWQLRSRVAYALGHIWPGAIRFAAEVDKKRWHRIACEDEHCAQCRSHYGVSVLQPIQPSQRDWHIMNGAPVAYAVKPTLLSTPAPTLDDVMEVDYYGFRFG